MGKKKTSQTYSQQNTYGQITPQDTPDIQAFRGWQPQIDPGLASQYANQRNKLNQSFINPLGGYATAGMQDAMKRNQSRALGQDEAQAFRAGQYDVNAQRGQQLGSLAQLTAPRIVQTGGSGQSQTTQSGNLLGQILGPAASIGASFIPGVGPALSGGKNRGATPPMFPSIGSPSDVPSYTLPR